MTFTTFFLIVIVLSVILVAEIVAACLLCARLAKHRERYDEQVKEKNKTKLYSFLGIAAVSMYQVSMTAAIILLAAEIILYAWLIFSLIKKLREQEETEKEADIALAASMVRHSISLEEAHNALSDEVALHLIEEEEEPEEPAAKKHVWVHRRYQNKTIINVDTLSAHFKDRDHVNLTTLKAKKLIRANVDYVKVLGRGTLDKCLFVEAHAFSADAVKMIVLTGGHAIKFVHHHHHAHHETVTK